MKYLLSSMLFLSFIGGGVYAQDMNLTEDLVLTETLVISENSTITGNGFRIICEGCNPVIRVEGQTELVLDNVRFPRVYERWIRVKNPGGRASWSGANSTGFIEWSGE